MKVFRSLSLILLVAALFGCRTEAPAPASVEADEASAVRFAEGFEIRQEDGHRVVEVLRPWRDAEIVFRYVLVPHGTSPPAALRNRYPDAQVVETPVRSVITLSTTHIGLMKAVGLEERIVGVSGAEWVYDANIRARVEAGEVADVGQTPGLNFERVLNLEADLVMVSGMGGPADVHDRLMTLGQTVALNGEYVETTPLGRAEWIKFVAAFFDHDAEAKRIFDETAERYLALRSKARQATPRPTVFTQAGWRGTWFVPGGQSFAARLLADAGADYLWGETEVSDTIPLDFETVLNRAREADYWLDPGQAGSLDALIETDARYRFFEAWQNGQVYSHIRRLGSTGGNDYWESGVARPDLVLADLVRIFHPELVPDHTFVYYERLDDRGTASAP